MTAEEEVRRAERAKAILDDPLVREALDAIKAKVAEEWAASPARDTEGRERLWLMHKIADKFEGHLRALMESGKFASARVAQVEQERRFNIMNFGRG